MKYLKYFEGNQEYQELDGSEFLEKVFGFNHYEIYSNRYKCIDYIEKNWEYMSTGELSYIKNLLPGSKKEYKYYDEFPFEDIENNRFKLLRIHEEDSTNIHTGEAEIFKLKDDWFYVNINTYNQFFTFKCDQLEGLIQCLREKL